MSGSLVCFFRNIWRHPPRKASFLEHGEDHGGDDEDVEEAGEHASDNGGSEGFHDFRAGCGGPHDGQEAGDDG